MNDADAFGIETFDIAARGLRFTAHSAGDGPAVLLLHGFPDTPHTFRRQLPALAEAGYRAIAVTLRGYEPSSRPADGNYSIHTLASDVVAWLDALQLPKVHLVGHDWGSAISFGAAKLAPERFHSLTQITVPNGARWNEKLNKDLGQLYRSRYIFFFQTPWLADAWVRTANTGYLERLVKRWSPGWKFEPEDFGPVRDLFSDPDAVRAALSYYRQIFLPPRVDAENARALFAEPRVDVPTLGMCGALDGCISADFFERCMLSEDYPAGLRVERIAGAGHFVHAEKPDAFNAILLDWLKSR